MGTAALILRGEVYDVDLGRPVGHEGGLTRPAVVVSADLVNNGPGQLVVVVPVGRSFYGLRSHIEVTRGSSGLEADSYARTDQVRSTSTERLGARRGMVGPDELMRIDRALRFVLEL